ncbi:MAG: tyrosine--tRNA ligase [Dehalococcoidia bacterium]
MSPKQRRQAKPAGAKPPSAKASSSSPKRRSASAIADLDNILHRGVIEIVPEDEFVEALRSGRKLRLKLGLDPSKPDLHIGHGVLLRKLQQLQELGHQVVLIVGDYTAQIGDPSGQSVMRPMLSADEVRANAETYMRQFFHVVDKKKTEVRWQSEWFSKFTLEDVVRLAGRFTVAQMLQREDFRQRFDAQKPLGIHELLYPLLQAYDSIAIDADVEFGGSDQLFNMLVGRELQQQMGHRAQAVFTMRLLVGTDGSQKMSKSLGNTIDLEDPPGEQFGKVMSLPDAALADYLELATDLPDEELAYLRTQVKAGGAKAMAVKKRVAHEIVAMFHGEQAAQEAEAEFERVFQQGQRPEDAARDVRVDGATLSLVDLLVREGVAASKGEARRLVRQGAVELDGRKVAADEAGSLRVESGALLRVGKHHFLRVVSKTS